MRTLSPERKKRYMELVGEALSRAFPEADIVFFGSLVEGDFSERLSDIDVALYLGRPLGDQEYVRLLKVLEEEIPLLRRIEVVDLARVRDKDFLRKIIKRGHLWKGSSERLQSLIER